MDSASEAQRGMLAAQVLDNEIYKEAIQSVREGIIQKWEAAPLRDKEGANELKLMLKLLGDVHRNIEAVMTTGKMASIQIERESMFKQAVNRFMA